MKKLTGILTAGLLLGSLLTGCGAGEESAKATGSSDFSIGLVTEGSGITDGSFNQSAWEGFTELAERHGLVENEGYRYLQSEDEGAITNNQIAFAEAGFDLTVATGFQQQSALSKVAPQFPDSNFLLVDAIVDEPNVMSVTFKEQESAFLVGVASAMTTQTGKVGFIGGVEGEVIGRFEAGFIAGVRHVDPNIEIISGYTGSFADASLGATLASAIYGQGADVIYSASGVCGFGVFTTAKNLRAQGQEVWVVGCDSDQYEMGLPENVTLTSTLKRVDKAVVMVAEDVINGNFVGGHKTLGLAEEGVGFTTTGDNLTEETIEAMERAKAEIIAGNIVVPASPSELK